LEFGCGDGSSEIFSEYCIKYDNLNVISFEHDVNWLNSMKKKYESDRYNLNLVNWSDFDYSELKKDTYDLVFVDQGDWDSRITTIDELQDNVNVFILHDYCYYNGFRGFSIPESEKTWALSIDKGSFFYEKYNDKFELAYEIELFPPTLILKKRKV
jgi:hypothetical protein